MIMMRVKFYSSSFNQPTPPSKGRGIERKKNIQFFVKKNRKKKQEQQTPLKG